VVCDVSTHVLGGALAVAGIAFSPLACALPPVSAAPAAPPAPSTMAAPAAVK
jgi:hypothetical protein